MNPLLRAVALAAAGLTTAAAHAAVAYPASGDGELILTVFDSAAKASYTLDLGIASRDFRSMADLTRASDTRIQGAPVGDVSSTDGYQQNWSLGGSEFDLFVAASPDSANWRYMVYGGDAAGSSAAGNRSFVTTVTVGAALGSLVNNDVNNALTQIGSQLDRGIVDRGDANNRNADVAANGAVFGDTNNGLYAIDLLAWGVNGAGFLDFSTDNAFADMAQMLYVTRSGASNTAVARTEWFDNDLGRGTFAMGRDASGYSLNYNLVAAPIPEPGTYAMLLLGLGALSLVARRRS